MAIESVLDGLSTHHVRDAAYWLSRMESHLVTGAVRQRLAGAGAARLAQLLTLLGWFGDERCVPLIRTYFDHDDQEVADAAYEAEQHVLGEPMPL